MRRRRTTSLLAAAATTISLVLVSAPQAGAAPASETEIQAQLYLAYAPVVYLAKGETRRPTNAGAFIQHAALGWAHDSNCPNHQLAGLGTVNADWMGDGRYTHHLDNALCSPTGGEYRSNQGVRPYDFQGAEGMYLDLDPAYENMGSVRAELYYDYQKGDHITYWFFYAYNDGPLVQNHEGDWERISIKLSPTNQPLTVAYFSHDSSCVLSYPSVAKTGTHPHVYSAKGSHASYPKGDETYPTQFPGVNDHTTKGGEIWATYIRPIHDVKTMSWYGYGGAWGRVGHTTWTSGPQGPSAFKSPTPSSWTSPACF
ncbi:Vps62-related protein [Longispora sp. NPDC051575]|uniref:Vps62-related protein n=1 Tax=Longispora sp. NPDC051575 TaxID=3154943 RepID=UPI00342DD04B